VSEINWIFLVGLVVDYVQYLSKTQWSKKKPLMPFFFRILKTKKENNRSKNSINV